MIDLSIVLTIAGIFIAILGLIYKVYSDNAKKVDAVNFEREKSIARVYQRFDEHKKYVEDQFVRSGTCDIVHSQSKREFDNLKIAMEKGFRELRDDFKSYNQTMAALIGKVIDKKND